MANTSPQAKMLMQIGLHGVIVVLECRCRWRTSLTSPGWYRAHGETFCIPGLHTASPRQVLALTSLLASSGLYHIAGELSALPSGCYAARPPLAFACW